jgi:hypothetical protein
MEAVLVVVMAVLVKELRLHLEVLAVLEAVFQDLLVQLFKVELVDLTAATLEEAEVAVALEEAAVGEMTDKVAVQGVEVLVFFQLHQVGLGLH